MEGERCEKNTERRKQREENGEKQKGVRWIRREERETEAMWAVDAQMSVRKLGEGAARALKAIQRLRKLQRDTAETLERRCRRLLQTRSLQTRELSVQVWRAWAGSGDAHTANRLLLASLISFRLGSVACPRILQISGSCCSSSDGSKKRVRYSFQPRAVVKWPAGSPDHTAGSNPSGTAAASTDTIRPPPSTV